MYKSNSAVVKALGWWSFIMSANTKTIECKKANRFRSQPFARFEKESLFFHH